MAVHDWFEAFVGRFVERTGRDPLDFPEVGSEYWIDLERSLRRMGATEDQADEASSVVADSPDLYVNQVRSLIDDREIVLAVDGGITDANVAAVAALRPDVIVSGSAIFRATRRRSPS